MSQTKKQGGSKFDTGKPSLSIIPREALDEMSYAFMFGAAKYSRHNFKSGIQYTRLIDAALRHITAFNEGEDIDPESNKSHIGHALASLAMLAYMSKRRADLDDRYKEENEKV